VPTPHDSDTLALLSAFLDGELSASEERDLLRRLDQDPSLQDALDDMAEQMAMTQRGISALVGTLEGDIVSAVLAGLPEGAISGPEGAAVLSALVADGEATAAQGARLNTLLAGDLSDPIAFAVTDTLAAVDATRVVINAPADVEALRLARLPELVGARVERTERGYALAAATADGALNAAEESELLGLVGADADLIDVVAAAVAARTGASGVDRAIGEALCAFAESPVVTGLAARAGDAAMQVILATAAQEADAAAKAASAAAATTTTASTTTAAASISIWTRLVSWARQGVIPLAAASAAAFAFVAIGTGAPDTAGPDNGSRLAEFRRSLFEALEPIALSHNAMLANTDLPVIDDNTADVQAIDAAGTTMVFQTAESNITVIWLAGLDDDVVDDVDSDNSDLQEQGT
jgi:hypothetical protein